MNIYFIGSIRGKKQYLENYLGIIKTFEKLGHKVTNNTIKPMIDFEANPSDEEKVKFYKKVLKCISDADLIVAEVSFSSMGVGYEISLALEKGKTILALHTNKNKPLFLEGIKSDKFELVEYNVDELEDIVKEAVDYMIGQQDVRFNFFISPKIVNYLDTISKEKRIPRAVYLRRLIEKDMAKDKEYKNFK